MKVVRRFLIVGALLLMLPVTGYAQEATLTGTVTDSTGAVLPGVTITAVNAATGNTFNGVTDERGIYRLPVRVGAYQVTAELSGFTTIQRMGVRRMYEQLPKLGIQFATPTYPFAMPAPGAAPAPAVAPPAASPPPAATPAEAPPAPAKAAE